MESPKVSSFITTYAGSKNPEVGRVGWSDGTVWLDANFGDASLRLQDEGIEGRRPLLVGAEVFWDQGKGPCDLAVDLGAGDIMTRLR